MNRSIADSAFTGWDVESWVVQKPVSTWVNQVAGDDVVIPKNLVIPAQAGTQQLAFQFSWG
ncbi:MAG: hypothetical protein U0996_04055 [Planctomycetaceae bacterium]